MLDASDTNVGSMRSVRTAIRLGLSFVVGVGAGCKSDPPGQATDNASATANQAASASGQTTAASTGSTGATVGSSSDGATVQGTGGVSMGDSTSMGAAGAPGTTLSSTVSGGTGGGGSPGNVTGAGGTAGAGGVLNAPPLGTYDFGSMPTTVPSLAATQAYATFKDSHLEDCGGGVYRVRWDNPEQTVSEGIAYGMLLAVSNDDREVFDGLWQYYENNLDSNGLMHWRRSGCEGENPGDNSDNAATDADLDAAMALVMAECRWDESEYGDRADSIADSLLDHATSVSSGLNLLHPGDVFGGASCLNASYFAPAYYRVFAERASSQEDQEFWSKLASDSYLLIDEMAHSETGFVPNWADEDGNTSESGPSGCAWYEDAHIFGSDAIRTPWRLAVDYLWWGTLEAKAWLDQVTEFVKAEGIANVGRKFELDGTPFGELDHSIISVGAFANGAMAHDQATADEFAAEALAVQDHNYFPDSLRGLYLLVLTGRFTPCGGT